MAREKRSKKEYHSSQEGFGIAGFILSIISIILAGGYGIILAILSLILCMRQQKKHPMRLAKAGIIISIIGIIFSIISIIIMVFLGPSLQQLGVSTLP